MVTAERPEVAGTTSVPEIGEATAHVFPLRLQLPVEWELTDERLLLLGSLNEEWHIEADCDGGLWIVAPPGTESSEREANVVTDLVIWTRRNGRGRTIGSGMVHLPNGWRRAPDAAWFSDERLAEIVDADDLIWKVCPDFVVEVRSASDKLAVQQEKMEMWVAQGARLGWLVDPFGESVWIYRPGQEPEQVKRPESLTATEIGEDLTIDFGRIWPERKARDGHG